MLITPAYAQAAGGEPSFLISLLPLILIFVVFWFLLIRPQQKRVREHREMITALKKGDKVLTSGGIYGTVARVIDDATLEVEIASGVKVRVARGTITENLSGTPAAAAIAKPANTDKPATADKGAKSTRRTKAQTAAEQPESDTPADADVDGRPGAEDEPRPNGGKGPSG